MDKNNKSLLWLAFLLVFSAPGLSASAEVTLVSVDATGNPGRGHSGAVFINSRQKRRSAILDDGSVFFLSEAPLHGSQDDNQVVDLYTFSDDVTSVLDLPGIVAMGNCMFADIDNASGLLYLIREITFTSAEEYLVVDGSKSSVEVHNEQDIAAARLAGDGGYSLLLRRDADGFLHLWRRDLNTLEKTDLFPELLADIDSAAISDDGQTVVFSSRDWGIVEPDNNGVADVFIYDASAATATLVSRRTNGDQAESASTSPDVSGDGRAVCFVSADPGLVAGDGNAVADIFVWEDGEIERCSVSSTGVEANADCAAGRISENGRFIVFTSAATNLVSGIDNGVSQVYVYDRDDGRLQILSVNEQGQSADADCFEPAISPNGRYVNFVSQATNLAANADGTYYQVYRVDRGAEWDNHVPQAQSVSFTAEVGQAVDLNLTGTDADAGDELSFVLQAQPGHGQVQTAAGAAVTPGVGYPASAMPWRYVPDDSTWFTDTCEFFVTDGILDSGAAQVEITYRAAGGGFIRRISVDAEGQGGNDDSCGYIYPGLSMSSDGAIVCFASNANLVDADADWGFADVYIRDTTGGTTTLVSGGVASNKNADSCAISGDGSVVYYFSQDGNKLIRHALASGDETVVATWVTKTSPSVSDDGGRVVFVKDEQVWLYDVASGLTTEIGVDSQDVTANGACGSPDISADGRVVAFSSSATNLVEGNSSGEKSVFLRYLAHETTVLASESEDGQCIAGAGAPRLSATGKHLLFSDADNKIYHRNLETWQLRTVADVGFFPEISNDGRFVYYSATGGNGNDQAYRLDLADTGGVPRLVSHTSDLNEGDGASGRGAVSATGRYVAFASEASGLIQSDTNARMDVFVNALGQPENILPVPTLGSDAVREDELQENVVLGYYDAEANDVAFEIISPPAHAAEFSINPRGPGRAPSISYRATADYYGDDSFVYRVGDAHDWSSPKTVDIMVEEVNDLPEWSGTPADSEVNEGQELRIELTSFATDVDMQNPTNPDELTFAVVSAYQCDWLAVDGDELVAVPGFDLAGKMQPETEFSVKLQVTDDRSDPVVLNGTFSITVIDVDRPPVMNEVSLAPGQPQTGDNLVCTVVAVDPDGDDVEVEYRWYRDGELQVEHSQSELNSQFIAKGESWRVEARAAAFGKYSDWLSSDSVTVVNTPPDANPGSEQVNEDAKIVIELADYGVDADESDELNFEIVSHPAHGTVVLTGSVLEYTSSWNELVEDEEGTDNLQYSVSDGQASANGQIDLTVVGINDAPVLQVLSHLYLTVDETDGFIHWTEQKESMLSVADIDTDEGDLRIALTQLPEKGILYTVDDSLVELDVPLSPADFPLKYQGESGSLGHDTLRLYATDGIDNSATLPLTVVWPAFEAQLKLRQGWNLISLPLIPDGDASPEDLLVDGTGRGPIYQGVVWYYDSGKQRYRVADQLEAGKGYWVFCPEAPTNPVVITGTVKTEDMVKTLTPGWHLVGAIGSFPKAFLAVESTGESMIDSVKCWKWNGSSFVSVSDGIFNTTTGYLIYLPATHTIDFQADDL